MSASPSHIRDNPIRHTQQARPETPTPMTLLKRRLVTENQVTRIYPQGGIFLSAPDESLQELSGGATPPESPKEEAIKRCVLCNRPSVHFGFFMSGEEAQAHKEQRMDEATGTFFGLCEKHNPHEQEKEVCDAVYKVMVDQLSIQPDLEFAESVMSTCYEVLRKEGHGEKEAIEIMLTLLEEDKLTDEYEFPVIVKRAMEIVLREELKKEGDS